MAKIALRTEEQCAHEKEAEEDRVPWPLRKTRDARQDYYGYDR